MSMLTLTIKIRIYFDNKENYILTILSKSNQADDNKYCNIQHFNDKKEDVATNTIN